MLHELSEDEVQMVVKALNHYYAYLVATLAERIQRKRPARQENTKPLAKKRRV